VFPASHEFEPFFGAEEMDNQREPPVNNRNRIGTDSGQSRCTVAQRENRAFPDCFLGQRCLVGAIMGVDENWR
jgi:hypothetical protein